MEYTDEQLKPARDSIFWIEVAKIKPNPYQPRKDFNEQALRELADSIRQYGVLQPLVVSRQEYEKEEGGLGVYYELIAGERRWRAAKLADITQVPALIREGDDSKMKLELAIIENLQREDLNAVDRARAFARLVEEFGFTHGQVGKKVGKSREYVSNTLRLLQLNDDVLDALSTGRISEGHTRPLMMLKDNPDEQQVLLKEILYKKITVREAERIARSIAKDKVRKVSQDQSPQLQEIEHKLAEAFGTRVHVEQKKVGGKLTIDFFSEEDLETILSLVKADERRKPTEMLDRYIAAQQQQRTGENTDEKTQQADEPMQKSDNVTYPEADQQIANEKQPETHPATTSRQHNQETPQNPPQESQEKPVGEIPEEEAVNEEDTSTAEGAIDDRSRDEIASAEEDLDDLYNIKNFSL